MAEKAAPGASVKRARILVTNDDGINAPGLRVLERIAKTLSPDVWVVAPETNQSGASHSLTMHRPLRIAGRALLATKGEALRAELALKKLPRAAKLRWCARGLQHFTAPASPPGSAESPG